MRAYKTNRQGFVLLLTLILMLSLSVIVGSMLAYLSSDFRSLKIQRNDAKAFWTAEAGIADASKRVKNAEITLADGATDSTSIQNVSFDGGTYSVTLSRSGGDITVTSTGTHDQQSRQLRRVLIASLPYAFNYAVFGSNSQNQTLSIGQNNSAIVNIFGNLFYNRPSPLNDTVQVRNSAQVSSGLIYADQVTGGGTYTWAGAGVNPSPLPSYPSFSTSYYDAVIAAAPGGLPNLTLSSGNLNLAGQTLYYNQVTISNSATITGPGTIVAVNTGNNAFRLLDNSVVGTNVTIITSGNVTVRDSARIQQDGIIYSRRNITVRDNSIISTSSVLAPLSGGTVTLQNQAAINGIVFADIANLSGTGVGSVMNGSVVANRFTNNRIESLINITFNSVYLPSRVPNGFTSVYTKKANTWTELS